MTRKVATDGSGRPDWRAPALRAGLEVALLALIATYLSIHLSSPLLVALIAVAAVVGSVAVLVRTVDRHAFAWVRYASNRAQQSKRQRRRERAKRQRQQQRARRDRSESESE